MFFGVASECWALIVTPRLPTALDNDVSKNPTALQMKRTKSPSCIWPSVSTAVSLKIWILNSSGLPVWAVLRALFVGMGPLPFREYDDRSSDLVPRAVRPWLERNILLLNTTKRVLVYLECSFGSKSLDDNGIKKYLQLSKHVCSKTRVISMRR